MTPIALTGHQALVLLTEVTLLLAAARTLGALGRRFGQPGVVGSLVAGVLLGPSVLGSIWPAAETWLLPGGPVARGMLGAVTQVSLLVLLVVLGAETDLRLLRRLGRPAALVSAGSIIVPGIGCIALAWALARWVAPASTTPVLTAVALGGALSISSLPVIARLVFETNLTRRNAGQLSIAAASANDVYGFLLLVMITVAAGTITPGRVLTPALGLAGIVAALALFGQRLADALLRRVRRDGPNVAGALTVSLALAFGVAATAAGFGVDAAFGAFAAGVVLGRSRFQSGRALRYVETFSTAVFTPLYFASTGLQMNVVLLANPGAAAGFTALLLMALAAKYLGSFTGGRISGLSRRESAALGVSLNGRGAMQVIIGSAALRLGLIGPTGFTMLLLASIIGTAVLPPVLRRIMAGWPGTEEERGRLAHEERLAQNVIVRSQRLLLAAQDAIGARAAALVLDRAWPPESDLTILAAGTFPDHRLLPLSAERHVQLVRVPGAALVDSVLTQANLGYGVIGIGVEEDTPTGGPLAAGAAALLNHSPLPLLLVRRARGEQPTGEFDRVVVAVNGTAAARAAQEVAHSLQFASGAAIRLVHVVTRPDPDPALVPVPAEAARAADDTRTHAAHAGGTAAGDAVLADAVTLARRQNVQVRPTSLTGAPAGEVIVRFAREEDADAVILGARVRRVGGHPFLGHSVEHVLAEATATTVVVVVLPDVPGLLSGSEPYANRRQR